jgi:hypothetical protein
MIGRSHRGLESAATDPESSWSRRAERSPAV